jgi:hypothetical protein
MGSPCLGYYMNGALWRRAWHVHFWGFFANEVNEVEGFGACLLCRPRGHAGV